MSDPFAAPYKTNDGLPLTATIPVEDANTFYAGPIEGSPQQPTFRKIMAADLPGGTPIFGGFSVNGAMYANSTDTIASTLPGAQYTSLVSNGTSTAPTFQPISLDQPAGLSGILGQAQGGTGTNTSTAKTVFAGPVSGANMLPTFRTLQQTDLPTINLSTSGAVSSQLPLANGGTAVDATNITQSYFFCGPENVPFISNPGPATFRAITINDVKDIASEIGLEMDSAAADYIVAKVNASASADNIAFRMSATGAATIASTMGVAGASTIAGNIPSTGADEIAGVMTSTGANSIAGKITSVGADAIAETMAGTGANIIAGNITSVGADAIAETMGQPGADIIGNNMSTIGAEHIATTMGTVGADIIGANLTPPYETTVTDVTTLQTDVTALQADVTTLQGDVTALDADVVSLDTSVAGLTTTVGGLTTSVAGLTTSVGVIEGEIVSINANLTILNAFQVTTQADLIDIYGQLGDQTGSGKIVKQRAPTITDSLLVTNDSLLGGIPPTINIYPQSGTAYDGYESHLYMANNTSVNYPSSINVTMGIGGNSSGSRYRQKFFVLAPQMYIDAPVTITTPLGISSGGTGLTSTSQSYTIVGPVSGSGAPTWRQLTYADISGGSSPSFSGLTANGVIYAVNSTSVASTTAGSQYQSMIANSSGAPTFQALALNQSAAVSGTLPVANGGTGVTTSTGTGSNVLSASPTLTGTVTVTGGASTALAITSTNSTDPVNITNTNTAGPASISFTNDTGKTFDIGVYGSTMTNGGQPFINLVNPLHIYNFTANNVMFVQNTGTVSAAAGACVYQNNSTQTLTIGVGSTGHSTFPSQAFITTSTGSVQMPITINATALALTTALPVTSGGTGVTTSTGTGSNVLSASPTFTGTIAAAALTLSTTLAITSGGTGLVSTSQSFAFIGPTSGAGAPTWRLLVAGDIPTISLTSGVSGTLPVANGGTGVTTSTGTGSNVLSASPTLTGNLTVSGGAGTALTLTNSSGYTASLTSSSTSSDVQYITNSATTGIATTRYINNGGTNGLVVGVGGATNATYPNQAYLEPQGTNGLVIKSYLSLGNSPTNNPGNCLTINNTSGNNAISVTCNNSATYNSIKFFNDTSAVAEFGIGGSTVFVTQDRNNAFISANLLSVNCGATFTGAISVPSLTSTAAIPVTSGGTGVTTSTGTGSVVLSASPTLTGSETITTTTNVASLSISSNATVDTIQVSSSNTASQASLKLTNNLGNSSYFIQGGSTNAAPYTDQTVIVPSAKGLVIKSHVSLGDSPSGNPTNCLSINNTGSSNSINVTCNNANTYNSIQFYNDTSSLAEFGVGGSTVGATQDRNRAFISANSLVINCPLIQSSSLMTVYTNFSSVGGFAGGYQNSLFTGSTQTNYGSLTPITSGTGARQMPVSGIYTFSYSWVGGNTNNLVFFISKNGVAYDPGNAATSPDLLGFSWQQIGTITATVYMNTTDTIAFQQYSPNTTLYPYGGFGENQCRMTLVMQTS